MNKHMRWQWFFSFIMFLIEAAIFLGLCFVFRLSGSDTGMFFGIYFLLLVFFKHYRFRPVLIWQEMMDLLQTHAIFGLLAFMIAFYHERFLIIKMGAITILMYGVAIVLSRTIRIYTRKKCASRVIVFGAGKNAEAINHIFTRNRFMHILPVAYVDLSELSGETKSRAKSIEKLTISLSQLDEFMDKNVVDEAFIVDEAILPEEMIALTERLHNRIPVIRYKPAIKIVQPYNTEVVDYDGNLFISVTDGKKSTRDVIIKKMIDIMAGIAGCLLLIPLTIYVKIRSLSNNDKDPIFFTQDRIGKNGKIIKIYKFRSMVPNAEQVLEELMEKDPKIREEYLVNKKLDPDPRVTPLGAFLRKTSLDEIPQFINVIKGEMSLIGPRPYLPREIPDMGKDYETIVKSKPGITGMWQANGRSDIGFADRCKLDVYYYDNWSLKLDIIIIIKTIKAVLKHDGAV